MMCWGICKEGLHSVICIYIVLYDVQFTSLERLYTSFSLFIRLYNREGVLRLEVTAFSLVYMYIARIQYKPLLLSTHT